MTINLTKMADDLTPAIARALTGLETSMGDIHRGMGEEFMAVTFSAFGAGGINRPHYWPDLSAKYQKSIKYYGRPKLILTGELSTSINIIALTAQGVEVGTDVEYAGKQQYGSKYLPARPYFPVTGGKEEPELTEYARLRIEARIMRDLLRFGLG